MLKTTTPNRKCYWKTQRRTTYKSNYTNKNEWFGVQEPRANACGKTELSLFTKLDQAKRLQSKYANAQQKDTELTDKASYIHLSLIIAPHGPNDCERRGD